MSDNDQVEEALKREACTVANKLLEVANGIADDSNNRRPQVFLVAMSIALGKIIQIHAASAASREQIMDDFVLNTMQVIEICDQSIAMAEAVTQGLKQ